MESTYPAQRQSPTGARGGKEGTRLEDLLHKKLVEKDFLRQGEDISVYAAPELEFSNAKKNLDQFLGFAEHVREKTKQPDISLEQLFEFSYGYFISMRSMHTLLDRLSYGRSRSSAAIFVDSYLLNEHVLDVAGEVEKRIKEWEERRKAGLSRQLESASQQQAALEKTPPVRVYHWLERRGGRMAKLSGLLKHKSKKVNRYLEEGRQRQVIEEAMGEHRETIQRLQEIAYLTIADFTLYIIEDAGRIFTMDKRLPPCTKLDLLLDAYDCGIPYITPPVRNEKVASRFTKKLSPLIRRIGELMDDNEPKKLCLCHAGLEFARKSAEHYDHQKESLGHIAYFAKQVFRLEYFQNSDLKIQYLDEFLDAASKGTEAIRQEWEAWKSNGRSPVQEREMQLTTHAIMHYFHDLSRFLNEDIGIKQVCKERELHERIKPIELAYRRFHSLAQKLTPSRYSASAKEPDFWKLG